MQQLVFEAIVLAEIFIVLRIPVLGIPNQRMPDAGQMGTDLVGTSRNQIHFQIGIGLTSDGQFL